MTRSTQRDERGAYLAGDGIYSDWDVPEKYRGDDVDRLAAYEDTGLDPEEIAQLKRERDAAVADLKDGAWCNNCRHYGDMAECGDLPKCGICRVECFCKDCRDGNKYEWRGMQKEER